MHWASSLSQGVLWWVIDGVKSALEVPAVAQNLMKPPEGNAKQGWDFVGRRRRKKNNKKPDFCLTTKDVRCGLMKLCVCKRREVPFHTFPTCLWLCGCVSLKAQSLRLLCQLASFIPPIHLLSEQCKKPEGAGAHPGTIHQQQRLCSIGGAGWRTLGGVCTHGPHAADEQLHQNSWFAALLLHYPECFTCGVQFRFKSSLAALSLCCHLSKESQVCHKSVCLVSFL